MPCQFDLAPRLGARFAVLFCGTLAIVAGCESQLTVACAPAAELVPFDGSAVVVVEGEASELAFLRHDLATDLGAMWLSPGEVLRTAPAPTGTFALTVLVSSTDEARALAGADAPAGGYVLRRVDDGPRTTLVVYASEPRALVAGGYALLEELGARFFHPMQDYLPRFGVPRLPRSLFAVRTPMVRKRGVQIHTLHPTEYNRALLEPSAEHLAEGKRLVDWLVKTGQNHLQWVMLESVPWDPFVAHARQLIDYAHARGVTVGLLVQLFAAGSLQKGTVLIRDTAAWEPQLEAGIDRLMTLPLDYLDLGLGEFSGTAPEALLSWLDHAAGYLGARYPTAEVAVHVHVGNYEDLYVEYMGRREYFYHLSQYADPRVAMLVHTINFFDLYRDWGAYKEPNFHRQREFLLGQLGKRSVSYYPESAYWVTADIDVPVFLPEYVHARHNDVTGLHRDIAARALAPLDGHVMFSTGHEWGYWLTDYLTAHLLWQPELTLPELFAHYGGAYGSCAPEVTRDLVAFTALQSDHLFDRRLMGYLAGEDVVVEGGRFLGYETHPERVQYEDVMAMDPAGRAAFRAGIVDSLDELAERIAPLEEQIAARCRGAGIATPPGFGAGLRPFCEELRDGYAITRLRARHAALTYRAVLALADGDKDEAADLLDVARATTDDAARVIARRERGYRFQDGRLTNAYDNATIYPFGLLRQAHTRCFWTRRERQVEGLIRDGAAVGLGDLPNCYE